MPSESLPADSLPNLYEIEQTSEEFHRLAAHVNDQLEGIGIWLNNLPSKMEVSVQAAEPSTGEIAQLKLRRVKDEWALVLQWPERGDQSFRVMQGSLSDKCIAVSLLPALLHSLHVEQRAVVERMREATAIIKKLPAVKRGK